MFCACVAVVHPGRAQFGAIDPKLHITENIKQALDTRNAVDIQDSLLLGAAKLAQENNLLLHKIRLYQLLSFLKQQQNELDLALHFAKLAIAVGESDRQIHEEETFRDAVTNLALCYHYKYQIDSSQHWINVGKKLAHSKDTFNYSILLSIEALNGIGIMPDRKIEILFDSAIRLASRTESPHDNIMAIFNKSDFLKVHENGDWRNSLELLISTHEIIDNPQLKYQHLKPYERMPFFYRQARNTLYRMLSVAYFSLSDVDNACHYQRLIADDYLNNGNFVYLPYVLSDLAEYETFRSGKEQISILYDSVVQLVNTYNKKESIPFPSFFYAAGWLFEQNHDYPGAITSYRKAALISEPALHVSIPALLRAYVMHNQLELADSLINATAEKMEAGDTFIRILFLKELVGYFELSGKKNKAVQTSLKYYQLKDSLAMTARYYTVKELETRFNTQENEKKLMAAIREKEQQKTEIERRKAEVIILLAGIVMLSVLTVALYRVFQVKRRQAIQLEKKNEQIKTLLRELHHRVKNNLQTVSSLLSLQSLRASDRNAKLALKESQARIEAMSLIHQKLYLGDNLRGIEIEAYVVALVNFLAESYNFNKEQLRVNVSMQEKMMDVDVAIPLGLIVNELVTNAFKHAFDGVQHPAVSVSLTQTSQDFIHLQVKDNGKGFKNAMGEKNAFGLKLVQTLVKQLKADFQMQNGVGTQFDLKVNFQRVENLKV